MIKKISSLFLLATLVFASSCSSDSDGGSSSTKVKYRVAVGSGVVISTVHYRDTDGSFVTVTAANPSEWSKEITVEEPFTASFDALITNNSGSSKPVQTYIYVNGEETQGGSNFIDDGDSFIVQESMDLGN